MFENQDLAIDTETMLWGFTVEDSAAEIIRDFILKASAATGRIYCLLFYGKEGIRGRF